jgi:hypothetical protein
VDQSVASRIDKLIEKSRAVRRGRINPMVEKRYQNQGHRLGNRSRSVAKGPTPIDHGRNFGVKNGKK